MSPISLYLVPILFILYIASGTLITQNLAKNNEWNPSFKTAFIVMFIWMTITYSLGMIFQLITENLSFTEAQVFISLSFYIIILILSLSTFLILGPFIVKKFYEIELRESFFMTLRILLYQGLVQVLFFPLYLL